LNLHPAKRHDNNQVMSRKSRLLCHGAVSYAYLHDKYKLCACLGCSSCMTSSGVAAHENSNMRGATAKGMSWQCKRPASPATTAAAAQEALPLLLVTRWGW
jgi:hypothetical protein